MTKKLSSDNEVVSTHILPNFCNSKTILLIIVVAQLLAIVMSLSVHRFSNEFFLSLAYSSMFIQTVALLDCSMICFLRRFAHRISHMHMIILVYIGMQLITLLVSCISSHTLLSYSMNPQQLLRGWQLYGPNVIISMIISALIMRYFYIQHQWQVKQQAETAIRIAALQARIRPHFLFNSMNTIANLVYDDPEKAENAVLDLADLYRATLAEPEMVTLNQEIKHANGYLRIEQIRLGDRLTLDFDISTDCLSLLMPSMVLQPLVENAVYHGIESVAKGGVLHVKAYRQQNSIHIVISNPLPDSPRERHHTGNHMALNNIQQRLLLTYGKRARLSSSQNGSYYIVNLCIPVSTL